MEPLAVRIDHVPGVIAGADGDAGDVRSTTEEFERLDVGAADGFQLSGMWSECPRNSSGSK